MTTIMTAIIETIFKSSVILGITAIATLVLRRQSAALRHTVWAVGLFCSLALPLFGVILPAWHVRPAEVIHISTNVIATPPMTTVSGTPAVPTPTIISSTPGWLTPETVLLLVWLLGVTLVAALLLREAIRLARVAFGASTVEHTSWGELVWEVSQALRLSRHVRLIRNPAASVLGTWGAFRPRVILPRESESWSDNRMRVVLAHELAHVKRNDWLVQVIAEVARAIYWFNPLFALACTHLRRESEHACDDAAMTLGGRLQMDGPTYAGHVLDLARTLKHSAQPNAAALAMASTSNLERRLVAMLNPSLNRRVTGWGTVAVIVLLALGLTLPIAALSSQAPLSIVSVIPPEEPAPQKPIQATPTTSVAVQRTAPRTVAAFATARPVAEAVPAPPVQNPTATLSGRVTDQSGAVIPGVSISLTANSSGVIRRIMTDVSGNFTFTELPRDNYSATADLPGFKRASFSYLVVDPGSARLNIVLKLAELMTTVDISVQAPPGLKCFSVFGAVKADGTPFTAADCPGGTILVAPIRPPVDASPVSVAQEVVSTNSPQTATPATGQPPIRVGGHVQTGNLLVHPNPAYPDEARRNRIQGTVTVSGVVTEDGQIRSLKIIGSSSPLLETSVLETLQNWKYKPTLLNGVPVEVMTVITLNFMFAG